MALLMKSSFSPSTRILFFSLITEMTKIMSDGLRLKALGLLNFEMSPAISMSITSPSNFSKLMKYKSKTLGYNFFFTLINFISLCLCFFFPCILEKLSAHLLFFV